LGENKNKKLVEKKMWCCRFNCGRH